jgi:hypothetical protein
LTASPAATFDLFGIVKRIVDAKAQFRSLAEPWADTGTSTGRLMLAVLGGLADVERDPQQRRSGKRPPDGAHRALRCKNWRTATMSASPPFAAQRGRRNDTIRFDAVPLSVRRALNRQAAFSFRQNLFAR